MFEVSFSEQAMGEVNRLDLPRQLKLVEGLGAVTALELENPREPLGRFQRDGVTYFRLRLGDHRCYFEQRGQVLHVHYLLTKNSFTDFIFRAGLPAPQEQMVEQNDHFWRYLETALRPPNPPAPADRSPPAPAKKNSVDNS